jgi:hypothetical protein
MAVADKTTEGKSSNRGAKPGQRFGGRVKGTPNKVSSDVKGMILGALHDVGGSDYLRRQAEENPVAFMTLVGKVLPMQLTGAGGGAIQLSEVKLTIIDPANS